MRVVECLGEDFVAHCTALATLVGRSYTPDLIVGVRRGGAEVARQIQASGLFEASTVLVSASRPATTHRRRARLDVVVGRLPRFLVDRLRIAEHRVRLRRHALGAPSGRTVQVPGDVVAAIAGAERILVVDDAVDTGETLSAVSAEIGRISTAEIRTAAITVTFPEPLMQPDYALERDVLMRFPWSLDAGGRS